MPARCEPRFGRAQVVGSLPTTSLAIKLIDARLELIAWPNKDEEHPQREADPTEPLLGQGSDYNVCANRNVALQFPRLIRHRGWLLVGSSPRRIRR
jgi:hypothetical protein